MSVAKQVPSRHLASLHDDGAPSTEVSSPNRFALTWPLEPSQPFHTPLGHTLERSSTLSSSEGESDHSEKENLSSNERYPQEEPPGDHDVPTNYRSRLQQPLSLPSSDRVPDVYRASRIFTTPSSSQLEHLQNPCRPRGPSSPALEMSSQSCLPQHVPSFHDVALELADSVQMVVQTLLQISPAQILDPAKEQYAACSLLMPTTCVSAVLTTMKNLNFLSANESDLFANPGSSLLSGNEQAPSAIKTSDTSSDFDVGEMLQAVGDALSGCAAHVGVDLVLFHSDVGLRHVAVRGEEFALSNILTQVIRQVINTARSGDSVDVGLSIRSCSGGSFEYPTDESEDGPPASSVDVFCTFEITHNFGELDASDDTTTPTDPDPRPRRSTPEFGSQLLRQLFLRTGGSFICDLPKRNNFPGRVCEITFRLAVGDPCVIHTRTAPASDGASPLLSGARIAKEPSLEDLSQFSETLRGKKATLYASGTSSFAHHLTSYLTAWGLDVSHVSSEQDGECFSVVETVASSVQENSQGSTSPYSKHKGKQWTFPESHNAQENPGATNGGARSPSISFVFVDDDVSVLHEQIQRFRTEQHPPAYTMYPRKRPSLAANHRPKSSSQVARALGYGPSSTPPSTVGNVVVHFTSLANYKVVRDIIQRDLAAHATSFQPPLEVMIIPKPAGPRRFLTALHTALTKPFVDPFFAPIATSPITPAIHGSPFFSHGGQQASPRSPLVRPWNSTRSASDRSARSPRDGDPHVLHPPSPLSIADTAEYFPDGSVKLGTAPASGLVFSSPDGQPAGIVFNPRAKSKSHSSANPTDKSSKLQFLMPKPERLRGPATLQPADTDERSSPPFPLSFAALHSADHSAEDHAQSPSQTSTPTPISTKGKVRKPSVLADDIVQATSPAVTLSRRGSPVEARKVVSQPSSPNPAESPTSWSARRKARKAAQNQKLAMEGATNNKSGKNISETIIVPPISVLIVDDNPINRTILSTFMRKKKVKYDVAKNGEEAVEKWRNGNFQLILMDIQMPVMDGIEATKEIRDLEGVRAACVPLTPQSDGSARTPRTPPDDLRTSYHYSVIIVALTASSLESDRVAALAAGCNDFLTKPVSLQWLNNKLTEWGAIKALQMWADMPSEEERSLSVEQSAQAQVIARRLHVPDGRGTAMAGDVGRSSSKGRAEGSDVTPISTSLTVLAPPTEQSNEAPPKPNGLPPRGTGGNQRRRQSGESTTVSVIEASRDADDVGKSSVGGHRAAASGVLENELAESGSGGTRSTSAGARGTPLDLDAPRPEP